MDLKFVAANLLLERLVLGVLLVFCVECYQLKQKYLILLSSHNAPCYFACYYFGRVADTHGRHVTI